MPPGFSLNSHYDRGAIDDCLNRGRSSYVKKSSEKHGMSHPSELALSELVHRLAILADAVMLAYRPNERSQRLDWVSDTPIQCGDVTARALVSPDGYGILAIAGTDSVWDFATSLQTRLVGIGDAWLVHTGFMKSAQTVLAAFTASNPTAKCWRDGNYYLTGHSMGGATAAILPLLLQYQNRLAQPRSVIAFGSPNYTQGVGSLLWPAPVMHIQSRTDLVSHIPNGLFGFRPWTRAGQQVYIDDKSVSTYAGHELVRIAGYIIRLARLQCFNPKSIREHSMIMYARRVRHQTKILKRLLEGIGNES